MISVVITAFKEERTIAQAIESVLSQDIPETYELIVSAPDAATIKVAKKYKKVKVVKDKGRGKSTALNLIFKKLKGRIWILTDGDIYLGKDSIKELLKKFEDKKVGVVSGRVIPQDSKKTMFGYWAHLLAEAGAHEERMRQEKTGFLEATGYLFALRAGVIKIIPVDVAEDTIIPFLFFERGYKIAYAPKARVYVKNPETLKDWLKQRIRTAKAHQDLDKYVDTNKLPRVKSFYNEAKKGTLRALSYPKNLKEFYWTLALFPARLLVWLKVYEDNLLKINKYKDDWERIQSAR